MKKNGFTLIEIIASVLILLVLTVLTTPSILNMIEKAKATSKESAETRILDATKEYIYSYNRNILSSLVEEGDTSYVSVEALLSFGLIEEKDLESLPNAEAYIGVQLGSTSDLSYTLEYDVDEVTLTKPYVVVLGDNPYYTEYNNPYTDPGIIAFDADGTNITDDVVRTGTVNTAVLGQYILSYSVTGTNGEVSETVTRTVIVRDTTLPVVTVATISSNNVYRTDRAKKGDTVTLLLTFSKPIVNTPTVTIGGRTATITGSGTTRTATYTIPTDESTLIEGILAISVSNYLDAYSNLGTTRTTITSGNDVIYDVTPAVFTSFTIGSGNPTYTTTDAVTLYISASRAAQMCISTTTSCTAWQTYASTKAFTLPSGDGSKTVYIKFRNEAGLETAQYNDSIILDMTAPTCTTTGGSSSWFNTNRTITGTCTDATSGCTTASSSYTYTANTNTTTAGPGVNGAAWTVTDLAGNSSTCLANQTVRIDKTAPTCVSSGGSTTWYNTNRTITGTCSDTGGSTCSAATVTKTYSTEINSTIESPGTVTDVAGNSTVCAANVTVKIDKTAPTCASSGSNATWTNTSRVLTGTCSDTAHATINSGCSSATITKTYSTEINSTTETPGTVTDNAGNSVSCPATQTVKIDKTAPTCATSGGSTTWFNTDRTITGTCSDTGGSNCSTATVTKTYTTNTNSTTESPGTVTDIAGNSTVCASNVTVKIDKTAPTCVSSGGSSTWINTNRVLTGTCSDTGGSTCTSATITKTYSTNTNSTTESPGTVTDVAGNSVVCPANQTVKVDVTAPTCVSSGGNTNWVNTDRTITGTCSDTGGSTCTSATITKTYSTNTNSATETPGTVTDVAGNSVVCPANQTVKIDKTTPTCTTSGGSSTWFNTDRTITGTCTDVGGSSCTVASSSYTYTTNTNTTTAGPGTGGAAWTVTDTAGNSITCPANQTVKIDKTAPTCTNAGGSTTWYNTSRTITGTCADALSGCVTASSSYTYTANTNSTTAGPGASGAAWTATDNAGNTAVCAANQTVRIDKTAPTCVSSGGSSTWVNTSRTITGTCSDTGGSECIGNINYIYNPAAETVVNITNGGPGVNGSAGTISDNAGNTATCLADQIVKIDKIMPALDYYSISPSFFTYWSSSTESLFSSLSIDSDSRAKSVLYCLTNETTCTPTTQAIGRTEKFIISQEADKMCYILEDNAGNITPTICEQIFIDFSTPTATTHSPASRDWANTDISITLSATDARSGIKYYRYCTTTNGTTCTPSTEGQTVSLTGTGQYTVCSRAIDNAYNTGATTCSAANAYKIDKIAPPATAHTPESRAWANTDISITLSATDVGSEIAGYEYCSTTNGTTCTPATVGATITLSATGQYTVCSRAKDAAGNYSTATCSAANAYKIDKIAPTCATSGGSTTWFNTDRTITGTCSDTGGSTCSSATVTKTYTANTNTTTASPGTVTDNAGNSTVCAANVTVRIDKTAPTCVNSGGSTTWFNTDRTITGTCSDTGGSACSAATVTKTYSANINSTTESPGTVTDNAGNSVACPGDQTVKIDKTAPTCVSSGGSSTWINTNRVLTGTCSDTGGSTCSAATVTKTYSVNTNSTTESPGTVTDVAGNSAVCPATQTVKVDVTKPTYTSLAATSTASTITLTVTGGADALSGVASYDYYLNGTKITNSTSASYTYTGLSSGTSYTVSFDIIDNSGNKETGSTTKATVVNIPTSLTATNNTACQGKQITVSWNANGNSSGTSYVVYVSTDNVTFTELATTTSTSYVHTGLTTELVRYYKVKAKNITTSVESALTASVTGRTLASPVVTATKNGTLNSGTINIALSWTAVPGAASYGITIFDGRAYRTHNIGNVTSWNSNAANIYPTAAQIAAWNLTDDPFRWNGDGVDFASNVNALYLKANGGYTSYTYYTWVHVHAYDSAGRESGGVWAGAYSVSGANMDTDSPTCTSSGGSESWFNTNRTITGTCADITGGSGCTTASTSYTYTANINTTTGGPGTSGAAWTAYDVAGNSSVCAANQTVRIDKSAPTITLIGNNPLVVGKDTTYTEPGATAWDNKDGDVSSRITITGTVNTAVVGTYTRTYTVTDLLGNSSSTTRTVNVITVTYTWKQYNSIYTTTGYTNPYYTNEYYENYIWEGYKICSSTNQNGEYWTFNTTTGYTCAGSHQVPLTGMSYNGSIILPPTSGYFVPGGQYVYDLYSINYAGDVYGYGWNAYHVYGYIIRSSNPIYGYVIGSTLYGTVTSTNASAYPVNGRHTDGYWYVRQ